MLFFRLNLAIIMYKFDKWRRVFEILIDENRFELSGDTIFLHLTTKQVFFDKGGFSSPPRGGKKQPRGGIRRLEVAHQVFGQLFAVEYGVSGNTHGGSDMGSAIISNYKKLVTLQIIMKNAPESTPTLGLQRRGRHLDDRAYPS